VVKLVLLNTLDNVVFWISKAFDSADALQLRICV
jgi:hypothetical protein